LNDPRLLVLYHANCADGFGAAFAAWKRHGRGADYVAVNHGEAPPNVAGRAVVIADFAYPRAVLLGLRERAASLVVLDHHKSAAADLEGLDFCRFDMTKSGAILAWEYFHPGTPPPPLLAYVQDKDLWQWKLEASGEVSAALASHPFDFELWDRFTIEDLRRDGVAIRRYQGQLVREICSQATRRRFAGHDVPCVNTPVLQSFVGNALARGEPFVMLWHERPDGTLRVSLRAAENGADCSEIARQRGGGGHAQAAGFPLPNHAALDDPAP
jgi:oligoribonuclease NrnB/cAMP/cGMP phosphodiesterase (DHH superfamily)